MTNDYDLLGQAARERIAATSKAAQAGIVDRVAKNVRRLYRRPADPVELLTDETLQSLRAINHEVSYAIERIEQAQRQWKAQGRPIVIVPGGEATPGEHESARRSPTDPAAATGDVSPY